MRFLSLFSGIEAASQAWLPIGWHCVGVAEVDPFPCAVLAHHYPDVPNLGDVTAITQAQVEALGPVDVVVGGFPCQDLSVAGKRKGLRHADGSVTRSGLFFDAMRIVRWARPRWLLLENVPGLFSSHGGRDFAAVVGEVLGVSFDPPAGGWKNAGVAVSDRGLLEWATLDAQFFGVPQRRRRVFALADFGDWASRPPVLLERESLSGHPAPRREAGQVAPTELAKSLRGRSNASHREDSDTYVPVGTDFDCDGGLIAARMTAFGEYEMDGTASTLKSRDYKDATDLVAHSLRADGFDASEDGTGRGTPLVPTIAPCLTRNYGKQPDSSDTNAGPMLIPVTHAFDARQSDVIQYGDKTGPLDTDGSSIGVMTLAIRGRADGAQLEVRDDGTANAVLTPSGGRGGIGVGAVAFTTEQEPKWNVDQALTLTKGSPTGGGQPQAVAFSAKDYGADAGDIAPTLRAGGHTTSHANGGVMPAVAQHMAVRRLTPTECARLQGFPDHYLDILYRGKPAADGPRYKALGNSMAVPVMAWIGKRIQMVEEL